MNYKVLTTPLFTKQAKDLAKKHSSFKDDLKDFIESLKTNPTQGKSIGKDCYKVRLAITSKGKGKSGGIRIITCVKIISEKVYLTFVYDKTDKESLTHNELKDIVKEMAKYNF